MSLSDGGAWHWAGAPLTELVSPGPQHRAVLQPGRGMMDALQGGASEPLCPCIPRDVETGTWVERPHSSWSPCPQKV